VNNKYKDELMYSALRSGNNSKLNKFSDIQGEYNTIRFNKNTLKPFQKGGT
jgi:hypothetical protein